MRLFVLNRVEDATGVSGTGIIAEGVQLTNGRCVLSWMTQHTSTGIYDNIEELEKIHGHQGMTKVEWVD